MSDGSVNQLQLDVGIYPKAHISDFIGDDWTVVLDAVRQMSMGLLNNCLFYGYPESGKSHLLVAMCTLYKDMGKTAIYLPIQDLLAQPSEILDTFSDYDLIAIDDIDFLNNNKEWQEAIFHLFNKSLSGDCQLAFVANTAPHNLDFEVKDLLSRISQCTSFALPKVQLVDDRKQILQNILSRRNLNFNSTILSYLANHGPMKTGLMISVVDELQALSPEISHKKLKKTVREKAESIIEKYALLDLS